MLSLNANSNGGDASRVGEFFSSLVPRDKERGEKYELC